MIRKATILPVEAKEVEWVRYTGDNFKEIEQFINAKKTDFTKKEKFYLALDGSEDIYWKEHGYIRVGDFVVVGMDGYKTASFDGYAVISWKVFPRMISEDIPLYLDEYKEWSKRNNKTEDKIILE